jgi:hypothetical protein
MPDNGLTEMVQMLGEGERFRGGATMGREGETAVLPVLMRYPPPPSPEGMSLWSLDQTVVAPWFAGCCAGSGMMSKLCEFVTHKPQTL